MEVLEGESLGDRLARDRRIHWVEAIDILRGVLYGLRHAHERGVVHRDIKPDNVYLAHKDGDPVIKILDFGIAKLYAGSADDPASTRAGLTVGTPAYLSPEQAVGGEITPASDLYSASIVLYEMLAGRAPFEDKDPLAMLGAHVSRRPPPFADVAPGVDVPPELEDIIQHGLVKTAVERISTATDYLAMLDRFSPPLHMPRLATAPVVALPADQLGSSPIGTAMSAVPTERSAPVSSSRSPAASSGSGSGSAGPGARGAMSAATPLPGAARSPVAPGSRELAPLPRAIRAVSLGDVSEPIPLSWIVRSGVVIGLVIVVAIALAIAARCTASEPSTPASAGPITKSGAPASGQPSTSPEAPASAEPDPSANAKAASPGSAKPPPATEKPAAPAAPKPPPASTKPSPPASAKSPGSEKSSPGKHR
jgi:serine/threonine-protein kinase